MGNSGAMEKNRKEQRPFPECLILEDGTGIYRARSQELEYLNYAGGRLPGGITPARPVRIDFDRPPVRLRDLADIHIDPELYGGPGRTPLDRGAGGVVIMRFGDGRRYWAACYMVTVSNLLAPPMTYRFAAQIQERQGLDSFIRHLGKP